MNNPNQYLRDLHTAYERWIGSPDEVIEFRQSLGHENVPSSMDILFFLPAEGPDEDDITTVATSGMSSHPMHGPYERVEMALEYKGSGQREDREILAKQLAELATVPFREGRYFVPNMVLENVTLHPFDRMRYALITKWNYQGDIFLPEIQPQVALLRLTPLYQSEADVVGQVGDAQAFARFWQKGIVPEDFEREPVV